MKTSSFRWRERSFKGTGQRYKIAARKKSLQRMSSIKQ